MRSFLPKLPKRYNFEKTVSVVIEKTEERVSCDRREGSFSFLIIEE